MPKINLDDIPQVNLTGYPTPFDREVEGRWYRRLAPTSGLTKMGASHVVLKPGAWSSQRHWHDDEDEMVIMLSGEAVLIEDGGETILRAGDIAAWAAGITNGHHLINRSNEDCAFVAIGAGKSSESGAYSDIDMKFKGNGYFHKDGTPYPVKRLI